MCSIPPRRQATLALRIAGGLGPCAAARGAGIDESDVRDLLHVASFKEMVGSWAQILAMDPTARRQRLELLAQLVIEAKLAEADFRTALLVQRAQARNRDIVASLANGFERLALRDRASKPVPPSGLLPPPGPLPPPEPLPRVAAAVAEAETARRLAKRPDPEDRASWRKAGELRRQMFDEQLLHHADEPQADEPQAGEPAAAAPAVPPVAPPPAANRAGRRRLARLAKAGSRKPGRLDPQLLRRLRQKFAGLPPASLAMMLERAPADLQPYFEALAREARQGKLWPKGP